MVSMRCTFSVRAVGSWRQGRLHAQPHEAPETSTPPGFLYMQDTDRMRGQGPGGRSRMSLAGRGGPD